MAADATVSQARMSAADLVDLGLRACQAYQREDLSGRLRTARRALADPAIHIVVAGEFKQGKSSLVNALIGADICPVDDDVATAVPTYVRYGEKHQASLLLAGDPPGRQSIEVADVRRHVVERDAQAAQTSADKVVGVQIMVPRKLLAGGLVLVDTPGVGGLGSVHAAASLAAISTADAVLFVTDASQELTRSELDFLRQARQMCDTVLCLLTKIDFYPAWRRIREMDERHLSGLLDAPVMALSSTLRTRAVKTNDTEFNAESGFPDLVRFVTDRVGKGAAQRLASDAAAEVLSICEQLTSQFQSERAALADPAAAQQVIAQLNRVKQHTEELKNAAAKWNQTLNDGISDLTSDIDHDLRTRIRRVVAEAEDAVAQSDPADTWSEMQSWLERRVSHELIANYGMLRSRAAALSELVSEHFRQASDRVFDQLAVYHPVPTMSGARIDHKIELEKMKFGKQAMVALKSAYGGTLMFVMLGAMTGIVLGPLSLGIGLVMGRKGLREEKKRQRTARQSQAKNAVRRYCDEISFLMSKDSRDTLRRIQRQLRDYYGGLADELSRSNAASLAAVTEAVKRAEADRAKRLKDIDAELVRLRTLMQHARAVAA